QETDFITVHYTGWTSEGRLFDSSHARNMPGLFALNRVMAGWRECVLLMKLGETRRCWVPQDLAFKGQPGRPAGTVVFDIELLDVRRTPSTPPPDVAAPPADAASTPSGLFYKVIKAGTGTKHPAARDNVTVHYSGWTTAGMLFDSSVLRGMPVTLDLNNVIRGWTEGVPLMVEGERTRFWVPEKLAYRGERGKPRGTLVFDIDLIAIHPPITSGSLFNWTQGIYALHAFSLLTGIVGAATVVGAFLTGWPSLIAVILNYVKRRETRGTWLESHFRWQIRTFWYGLLWVGLCLLFVVLTLGIGLLIAWLPLGIVAIWFVYRVVRGWLALRDGRPMYAR